MEVEIPIHHVRVVNKIPYSLYKFNTWLTLKDFLEVYSLMTNKTHLSVLTCVLNGEDTLEIVFKKGNVIYVTGYPKTTSRTIHYVNEYALVIQIPQIELTLLFIRGKRMEIRLGKYKCNTILCTYRKYKIPSN